MNSLKSINQKILDETINANLILKNLNEAIDAKNIKLLGDQIEKLNSLVSNVMPSFNSLKQAIQAAEADVNNAVSDPKKAADITGKIISFYSKIWNFLSNDLIALSRLPAMRDFFDDQKTPDQNSNLNSSPNIKDIRTQLITALKADDSPWFKKALAMLSNNPNYLSGIPYLDINNFVNEFISLPKTQLKDSLEKINAQIKQIQNPEAISNQLTNQKQDQTQKETNVKPLFDKTKTELNNMYQFYAKSLGEKLKSENAQTLLKQIILNSFIENQTPEQLDAKIKDSFKY